MTRWARLDKIATTMKSMLVILGVVVSPIPARALAAANVDHGGYEMRVHLDRTLSIMSSRVGDRFTATVADPGPFSLARISGHVEAITPSGLFKGATEMYLSFDRIRFNDGEAYPINAEIIRLYDLPSGEQVDAQELIETHGPRRLQMLKRTGIGALASGVFGVTFGGRSGGAAIRPRFAGAGTIPVSGRQDL